MLTMENIVVFVLALVLNALGSVLLKQGASRRWAQRQDRGKLAGTLHMLLSRRVILGLLLQVGAVLGWLAFVSRTALSLAFPLSSISNVTILLASHYLLREQVSPRRWGGVALILGGIALIVRA